MQLTLEKLVNIKKTVLYNTEGADVMSINDMLDYRLEVMNRIDKSTLPLSKEFWQREIEACDYFLNLNQ